MNASNTRSSKTAEHDYDGRICKKCGQTKSIIKKRRLRCLVDETLNSEAISIEAKSAAKAAEEFVAYGETADPEQKARLIKAVLSNAHWVNNCLVSGVSFCFAVVVIKATSGSSFKVPLTDVKVDTSLAWLCVLGFTIAHIYSRIIFVSSCRDLYNDAINDEGTIVRNETKVDDCRKAFKELSCTGPLFFRGLIPRLPAHEGSNYVKISYSDPTAFLAYGAAIMLMAAVIPFREQEFWNYIFCSFMAGILLWTNWRVGAAWVTAASDLACRESKSTILTRNFSFFGGPTCR